MSLFRYLICLTILPFVFKAQSGWAFYEASDVFTVPAGITSITVEVLGGGGRGGQNGGGGGGGGGFAKGVYTVVPNSTLQVVVDLLQSRLSTLIKATAGSPGANGDVLLFTASGGQGGYGSWGTIINSSGGNGGMGWPGVFGGGGGGAAGIKGNAQNGENAPAYDAYTPNLFVPVAKGGNSGGGVTAFGGSGGGYSLTPGAFVYSVTCESNNGYGYGGGAGGAVSGRPPSWGSRGYCFISWGNSCKSVDPVADQSLYDNRVCMGTQRKFIAAAYDSVEWYADTILPPFAKGKEILSPPLTQLYDTFYVRTSGCPENRFVPFLVNTEHTVQVAPSFQYTALCWGDVCVLSPSVQMPTRWGPLPGQPAGSWGNYYYTFPVLHDSLVNSYIVGYNGYNRCPDTAKVEFYLRPRPNLTISASSLHYCEGDTITLTASGPALTTYTWNTGSHAKSIKVVPSGTSPQNVMATDSIGCFATESLNLEDRTPHMWVYVEPERFCKDDSVMLTAVGAGSYSWSTGQTTNPIWMTPGALTQFTIAGSAFGCAAMRAFVLQADVCTDLAAAPQTAFTRVFPNPTTGQLTITLENETEITVLTFDGRQMKHLLCHEGENNISLDLPPGIYFLCAENLPPAKVIVMANVD
jgi:hypothetical protein